MKLALILLAATALGALVYRWRHRKLLFWLTLPVFLYVALALVAGLLWMFVVEDTPPEGPALTPEDLRQWREAPDEEPADEKNGGWTDLGVRCMSAPPRPFSITTSGS